MSNPGRQLLLRCALSIAIVLVLCPCPGVAKTHLILVGVDGLSPFTR
jgi:hypothetical protein